MNQPWRILAYMRSEGWRLESPNILREIQLSTHREYAIVDKVSINETDEDNTEEPSISQRKIAKPLAWLLS